MRVHKLDGYDGLFGLSVTVAGTVISSELPSFRSIVVLCCLIVISIIYAKRLKNPNHQENSKK